MKAPETRIAIFSGPALTTPLGWMAFCVCSDCASALGSMPSDDSCCVENSR